MEIDVERLIMEIESRPAIWDIKSVAYSDRIKKIKQWEEVIDLFSVPGISDENKKEKGHILQAKWRHVRDTFIKECRKQALKSGSATAKSSQYRYYKQLSFLKGIAGKSKNQNNQRSNDTPSSLAVTVEDETVEGSDTDMPPLPKRRKRNHLSEDIGQELVNILKSLNQTETANQDPDRLFMLSLVPDFKRVPDRLKSVLKLNLLKCIMEVQNDSYTCQSVSEQYLNHARYGQGIFTTRSENRENLDETTQGTVSGTSEEDNQNTTNFINETDDELDIKTSIDIKLEVAD